MDEKATEQEYDGSTPIPGRFGLRQELFVSGIIQGMTNLDAYKHAGYSPNQSDNAIMSSSSTLVRTSKVAKRLAFRKRKLLEEIEITDKKVLQGMACNAFADIAEFFDKQGNMKNIHDIPKAARMAISGIEVVENFEGHGEDREKVGETVKVKCWDKNRALENLAKHAGLFEADNSQRQGQILFQILKFSIGGNGEQRVTGADAGTVSQRALPE